MFLSPGLVLPSGLSPRQACSCLQLKTSSHPSHHSAMATSTLSVCFELRVTCDRCSSRASTLLFEWEFPRLACQCGPCHCGNKSCWSPLNMPAISILTQPFFTNHWPQTLLKEPYSPKSVSEMDPGQYYIWGGILELKEWEQWNINPYCLSGSTYNNYLP